MRAAVAIAVFATGCISLSLGSGANVGLAGPSRVVNAQYGVGSYIKIKDAVVVEPSFHIMRGPLGKASPVLAFAARGLTHSHGWRPGYFGAFLAAGNGIDYSNGGQNVVAEMYRVGGGVSWDSHPRDNSDWWAYDTFGVIAIGVFYTHEWQESIGSGDFLGIELSVTGGINLLGLGNKH
jgi:hypothetical protein